MSFIRRITLALAALAVASTALAKYPEKPIKIIVPYPPGGTSDILARAVGPEAHRALGQPVVVENKPGATGNVGADFVAKSPADGYTLLLADIGSLAISPSVFPTLPFDPVKDFAPVVMVAYSPHILAVHPSVPAKNVKELVALAKAKPDSLNFAVSGIGGANHLAGIDFAHAHRHQVDLHPVQGRLAGDHRRGGRPGARDVQRHARHLPDGEGRQAARRSRSRAPSASPPRPTSRRSPSPGCPGFETGSFQGIVAPAGHAARRSWTSCTTRSRRSSPRPR